MTAHAVRVDFLQRLGVAAAILSQRMRPVTPPQFHERQLPRLYAKARRRALVDLEPYEGDLDSRLPADCPYTLGQILSEP